MRGSLGLPLLVLFLTSVACNGNAPLPTVNTGTGTAGMHPTAGSAGQAGSASGIAGAPGVAGTVGSAGVGQAGASGGSGSAMCGVPTLPSGLCVPGAYKRGGGACQCQDGLPCVCPGVGCVDPMLDPANCGACGMACGATSTCNAGACGAAPTMVSPAIAGCTATDDGRDRRGLLRRRGPRHDQQGRRRDAARDGRDGRDVPPGQRHEPLLVRHGHAQDPQDAGGRRHARPTSTRAWPSGRRRRAGRRGPSSSRRTA